MSHGAVIHELPDLSHGTIEEKSVIHHDFEMVSVRKLNELFRLLGRRREGFFDENVFAVLKSAFCQLEMRPNRSDDRNRVDIRGLQKGGDVRRQLDAGMSASCPFQSGGIFVANCRGLAAFDAAKIPDNIWPPISVPDHANANRIRFSAGSAVLRDSR